MTQEPIKIEIAEKETPFIPESSRPNIKTKAAQAGKTIASKTAKTAQKAWQSEPRRKVTRGVAKGATAVASKSGRFLSEKVAQTAERQARERAAAVQTRIRETDWKAEAKSGTVKSLRWLSERLARLAARVNAPRPKSGPETE